jgi:hypothetical protein
MLGILAGARELERAKAAEAKPVKASKRTR